MTGLREWKFTLGSSDIAIIPRIGSENRGHELLRWPSENLRKLPISSLRPKLNGEFRDSNELADKSKRARAFSARAINRSSPLVCISPFRLSNVLGIWYSPQRARYIYLRFTMPSWVKRSA